MTCLFPELSAMTTLQELESRQRVSRPSLEKVARLWEGWEILSIFQGDGQAPREAYPPPNLIHNPFAAEKAEDTGSHRPQAYLLEATRL